MPKIPEYESRQLASSIAGTPGVDTSTAGMFNAASTAFGAVADSARQQLQLEYVENMRELRARQAEQRAAEQAQKAATDAAQVSGYDMQFDTAENAVVKTLQEKHGFNTDGAMDAWMTETNRKKQEILDGIGDPLLRAKAEKSLQDRQTSAMNKFNGWISSRGPVVQEATINGNEGALAHLLSDSSLSPNDVADRIRQYQQTNAGIYRHRYGPEAETRMRAGVSKALEKRIADVANSGDGPRLEQEINLWTGQKLLDPQEAAPFLSRQREIASATERQIKQDIALQALGNRIQVSAASANVNRDNVQSLGAYREDLQGKLKQELTKPKDQQNLEYVDQLTREIKHTTDDINDFATDKAAQKRKEAAIIHDSQAGISARDRLSAQRAAIAAMKAKDPKAISAIEAYRHAVDRAANAGFLTDSERFSEVKWTDGKHAVVSAKASKGGPQTLINDALKTLSDVRDDLWTKAISTFSAQPAIPGKTTQQTTDIRNRAYADTVDRMVDRYKAKYGKDPDAAAMKIIHNAAMVHAAGVTGDGK